MTNGKAFGFGTNTGLLAIVFNVRNLLHLGRVAEYSYEASTRIIYTGCKEIAAINKSLREISSVLVKPVFHICLIYEMNFGNIARRYWF